MPQLCTACSGIHRSLGVHCSAVRSLKLDEWKEVKSKALESVFDNCIPTTQNLLLRFTCWGGNRAVNRLLESNLPEDLSVLRRKVDGGLFDVDCARSQSVERLEFATKKYDKLAFLDASLRSEYEKMVEISNKHVN